MLPDLILARLGEAEESPAEEAVELLLAVLLTQALSLSDALGEPVADTVPLFRPGVGDGEIPLAPLDNPVLLILPNDACLFSAAVLVAVVLVLLRDAVA